MFYPLRESSAHPGVRPPPRSFLLPRAFFLRPPFPPVMFSGSFNLRRPSPPRVPPHGRPHLHARVDEHPSYDMRLNSNGPAPQRTGIFLSLPGKGLRA